MKQAGMPTCPYCGKRVNLIRMWTLKRDGEFICPSCGGISNVEHSPLMNFFAIICGIVAFVIFAFTRFILNDESLMTCLYVLLPFAVFFVGSMFLVRLKTPVVRQGRQESAEARRDAAVMRRRQREAVQEEAARAQELPQQEEPIRTDLPVRHAAEEKTAAPVHRSVENVREPMPSPSGYTDISSNSGRFSSQQVRRTQPKQESGRDIYSSSRGQGYAYSTAAHLRNQDDEAAALRKKKIEMLRRLQQEQNRDIRASEPDGRNGQ